MLFRSREAGKNWNDDASAAADRAIKLQQQYSKSSDVWRFHTADEMFHRNFSSTARLDGIWDTISSVKTHIDRVRRLAIPVKGHMEKVINEHKLVIHFLDRGDIDGAMNAMREHLDSLHKTITRLKEMNSKDFEE